MIKVKPQPHTRIEHKLPKTKEGPEGGALTPPPSDADGLVVTESDSHQYVVIGRRPEVSDGCQSRRKA